METLRGFLEARRLSQATGLPLYTYRCTRHEFSALGAELRERLASGAYNSGPQTCQAFCLWAAEWWRRNHEGGPWRWEGLLAELDCDSTLAPGTAGYPHLCRMVADGLKAWRRELLRSARGRAFLVTLACEGGLPLRLVSREQASLRRYFKALLEEFRIFGPAGVPAQQLAERVAHRLPKSLRHDVVFELSGQLIAQIWRLQEEVKGSTTPVADLDRIRRGWRNELPLRVSDEVARDFLKGLLEDAAIVARGRTSRIKWIRSLVRRSGAWTLVGELELPPTIEEADFASLFGRGPEAALPSRGDLCIQEEGGNAEIVALFSIRADNDGRRLFALDHASRVSEQSIGPTVASARSLIARDGQHVFRSDSFSGAARLSELPWVFEREPGDQGDERLRFVGEGSVRLRSGEAFVAVPCGMPLTPDDGGTVSSLGVVENVDRDLYRVSGKIVIEDREGGRSVVQTGVDHGDSASEFWLHGPRRSFGRDGQEYFLGAPEVRERRADGVTTNVSRSNLLWKSVHPGARWEPFTPHCYGEGRLRYVLDGEVRFSSSLRVLPLSARVDYRPAKNGTQGHIEFLGFGLESLSVLEPRDVQTRVEKGTGHQAVKLHLSASGEPPPSVEVHIKWSGLRELRMILPFPALTVGFRGPSGRAYPADSTVSISTISGIDAVAVVPDHDCSFAVEGSYRGTDMAMLAPNRTWFRAPMREVSRGHFELDVGSLRREIETRLHLSDDVSGYVRLQIQSNEIRRLPLRPLRVSRYDLKLELAPNGRHVRLAPEHWDGLRGAELAELRVEAFPLLVPDHAVIPLERGEDEVLWELPHVVTDLGPWLVVLWHGDWCRAHPLCWNPEGWPDNASDMPDEPTRFRDVYRVHGGEPGQGALASVVQRLSRDPSHPDWPVVDNLVDWIKHLPPVTFPILRALADDPAAMALMALRARSDTEFQHLLREFETLPFRWWLVPRTAWTAAAESFLSELEAEFAALGDAVAVLDVDTLVREHFAAVTGRVIKEMPWLAPVFGRARSRVLGLPLDAETTSIVRSSIQDYLLEQRQAALSQSSILTYDVASLPRPYRIEDLRGRFQDLPGSARFWLHLRNEHSQPGRAEAVNAPVVAALCALQGERLDRLQVHEIWSVHDLDPKWFVDTFYFTYLYALGVQWAQRIDDLK